MDVQDGELSITNDGQGNNDDMRDLPNIIEKKNHGIIVSKTGEQI